MVCVAESGLCCLEHFTKMFTIFRDMPQNGLLCWEFDRLVCVFQGGAVSPSHAQPPAVGTSGQGKNLLSFLLASHRHTSPLACVSWCCVGVGGKTEIKTSAF